MAIVAGVFALSGGGGMVPALTVASAGADPAGPCSSGVIVAADFAPWGGDINSVCDVSVPANASVALVVAKFHPTGVAEYGGLAFICQIAGDPPHDSCATTPPASAYWSFWYAKPGSDTWSYSQLGPENLHPQSGSAEAWVFGGNSGSSPPRSFPSPDALRTANARTGTTTTTRPASTPTSTTPPGAATTTPSTALSPAGADGNGGTSAGGTSAGGVAATTPATTADRPTATSGRTRPDPATATGAGTVGPRAAGRTPTTPTAGIPKIVDAAPALTDPPPPSSPLPFVIGAAVVLALGATGGLIAWRRRRTG